MSKIRLLLVDDHAILREGLRAMLNYYEDVEIVGEAEDGEMALEQVQDLAPDVVLMDIAMPGMSGLEATRIIRELYPETHVLVLSQYEDKLYVLPLLKAGASGYVLKRALGEDLIQAVRVVARGENFLYPSVATMVLEQMRTQCQDPPDADLPLTPRELEILQKVAEGETSRKIAAVLGISVKTVEWHRGNIVRKLGVQSLAELVRYALEHGLTE
ncbi:MAG: response regulator transcription factor [Anaerolineales bacterium]|nr:response regulator transcription factor [Anaerolineales bacterium]